MNIPVEFSYNKERLSDLPKRPERSNKGTFGRVLLITGSKGMAGAAYLSALGAYRSGAGLVEIFTPEENRIILQTLIPEAIITAYSTSDSISELLLSSLSKASSVAIGCGLGKTQVSLELLKTALRHTTIPTVIDADALNLIAEHPFLLKYAKGMVITPHPAEMSRLTNISVEDILNDTKKTAYCFAKERSLVCVLKDHETAVSDGGERIYVNKSGNSGMATGGSGDVLAGVIASLMAQSHLSLSTFEAACLGVYIHGLGGDRAAELLGRSSVMARDIANNIRL